MTNADQVFGTGDQNVVFRGTYADCIAFAEGSGRGWNEFNDGQGKTGPEVFKTSRDGVEADWWRVVDHGTFLAVAPTNT